MRTFLVCILLILTAAIPTGCSRDDTPAGPATPAPNGTVVDPELTAGEIVAVAGWEFDPQVELPAKLARLAEKDVVWSVTDFQREVVTGDIVHYRMIIQVGPGEHDLIGLHRVVRERRPNCPLRAEKSLFLVHGMGKDFTGNFLPGLKSPQLADDFGFAVFMAQNDVDVWGLDSSYTLVPFGIEDFSFAAGWGLDKFADDIGTGIAVARSARHYTGNGLRPMTLLGYSQGALMSYAYLNRLAKEPRGQIPVEAFAPVDWGLEYDDAGIQAGECAFLGGYVDLWNDGIYGFYDDPDGFLNSVGTLAQQDPEGPSPYYDGFTNLQVFLFFTAVATPPSTLHWWAATFDADGLPVDTAYTERLMATEFWLHWAPMHPPTHFWADLYRVNCEDSPWETNLGAINLPVFSLEAGGGAGPLMAGTLDRLTSAQVTRHVVRLQAPEDAAFDIGHVDLFTATGAASLAWQPTLNWLLGIRGHGATEVPHSAHGLTSDQVAAIRGAAPAFATFAEPGAAPAAAGGKALAVVPDDAPWRGLRVRHGLPPK